MRRRNIPPEEPEATAPAEATPDGGPASLPLRLAAWGTAVAGLTIPTVLFLVAYSSLDRVEPDVERARQFHGLVVVVCAMILLASLRMARGTRRLLWGLPGGLLLAAVLVLQARRYTHQVNCQFFQGCEGTRSAAPSIFLLALTLLALTLALGAFAGTAPRGRRGLSPLIVSSLTASSGFLVASGFFLATLDAQARRADAVSTNEEIAGLRAAALMVLLLVAGAACRRRTA